MKIIVIGSLIFFVFLVVIIILLPFLFGASVPRTSGTASDHGIFVTHDGGVSWVSRNEIKDSNKKVSGLTITDFVADPKNSDRLFIGTTNSGMWKSEDAGGQWENMIDKNGVLKPRADVLRIVISNINPKLWFAAVYQDNRGALLKSEDGGESFSQVYFVPVERFGVFDVWLDESTGTVFVVTGQGGFLESKDGGRSWRIVRWFADGIVRLVPGSYSNSNFYILTSKGRMYKTVDTGKTWTDLTSGFSRYDHSGTNQSLVIDKISGALYLGSDYGLIRSKNGGVSWEGVPVIIPPEALPVLSVAVHPVDPRNFFISAQAQIYKTVDGGTTWSIIPTPTKSRVTKIVIDEHDPATVFIMSNR